MREETTHLPRKNIIQIKKHTLYTRLILPVDKVMIKYMVPMIVKNKVRLKMKGLVSTLILGSRTNPKIME